MDIVIEASKRFGNKPALITRERTLSFNQLEAETAWIASAFTAEGIGAGTIVALISSNSLSMVLSLIALLRMGAVAAPLNNRFPGSRIVEILKRLQPGMTFSELALDSFLSIAITRKDREFTPAMAMELPPVSIIHTSASTGNPKAAVHSFSNHWHSTMGSAQNLPFRPGDCWLLSLPLYHVGGYSMLFKCLLGGGALAVPSPEASIAESLDCFPVTHVSLVPTQLYRMVQNAESTSKLRKLKAVLLGGSAVAEPLLRETISKKIPLYLTYGSTEMSTQVSTSPAAVSSVQKDSGVVLPHREVMIAGDGEILVKGPCLFIGYFEERQLNPSRDTNGWFHTGDLGSISKKRRLTVLGRKDNMFVSGGENIHPEEIEKALCSLEGIEEAVVVPVPDAEYGMRPVAWIKVRENGGPDDATIIDSLRDTLGRLKTPVRITRNQMWRTLPGSAKIDRGWYRKAAEEN